MIAGEDIFVGERVGRAGLAIFADGVEQHHPVIGQQLAAGREEFVEMLGADMFEHADRHDPVERAGQRAIIDQLELDPVGHARVRGALAGDLQLLLAERDPEHIDVGDPVQI